MKRLISMLVVLLTLALCSLSYAQEAAVLLYYMPNAENTNPPLGCPCINSIPFRDGVTWCVFWDNNHNGWDEDDILFQGNFSCAPMNGFSMVGEPGYFFPEAAFVIPQLPTSPDTALYYILINYVGADACCWVTRSYLFHPGYQEIAIQFPDWTCADQSCMDLLLPPDALNNNRVILPDKYALSQNYPNPFNSSTEIRFDLRENTRVELTIYNTQGQKISTLADEVRPAGTYLEIWNGKNSNGVSVASGVYLYQIKTGAFMQSKKMVLLK